MSPVDDSIVWAVDIGGRVLKKDTSYWKMVDGELQMVSCGFPGVWGVNIKGDVVFREGTEEGVNSAGTRWTEVYCSKDLKFKWISCGGIGEVWGISNNDDLYWREDISGENPMGSHWIKIEGKFISVGSFNGDLWAITISYKIYNKKHPIDIDDEQGDILIDNGWECPDPEQKMTKIDIGPKGVYGLQIRKSWKNDNGWKIDERNHSFSEISVGKQTIWAVDVDHQVCFKENHEWSCTYNKIFKQV